MNKYELTEEHRVQLKPWADKWIANAMSTVPMTDKDREICKEAVKNLYKAANKTPPPDHRIVFVPSPFVLRFAGGFAAAIWHKKKTGFQNNNATRAATRAATGAATGAATRAATYDATGAATRDATDAATRDATDAATYAATRAATYAATYDATGAATYAATGAATDAATGAATDAATGAATDAATRAATYDATYAATRAATYAATGAATGAATYDATGAATRAATDAATRDATDAATYAATRAATYAATRDATDDATDDATGAADKSKWYSVDVSELIKLANVMGVGIFGLKCAQNAYNFWQGGNQWSAWDSFLTFFRYIAKLEIDYSKYDAWEILSLHSGPRIMHEEFCMISDRPRILTVNARNQSHGENAPFCQWSDGTALYSLNGVRVPRWVVETPADKFTKDQITKEQNADVRREIIRKIGPNRLLGVLDYKIIDSKDNYELITFNIGDGRVRPFLKMQNPSMDLVHIEGVLPEITTVEAALCYRNGLTTYNAPKALS